LISDIPPKTMSRIEQYISRPIPAMDTDAEKYRAFNKRLEELYKKGVTSPKKRLAESVREAEIPV